MNRFAITSFVLAFFWIAGGAEAQSSEGKIEVKAIAEIEIAIEKENGETELRRVPAKTVVPGSDVIYTITATNVSDGAVDDVVVTDPIPRHMSYLQGTAIGDGAEITFSVDSGSTFDKAANLQVRGENGTPRNAVPDDYTHIRWKFTQELAPGASRLVRFRARLQ